MTPTLSVLLCLELCLNQRIWAWTDRPTLRADKGPLVPLRSGVSLVCFGVQGACVYRLEKEQQSGTVRILEVKTARGQVEFPIPRVTVKDAGKYYCRSRCSSDWSEHSVALDLVVTGVYDPPSLSAWPRSELTPGQEVTFLCHSEQGCDRSALYEDGRETERRGAQPQGRGVQANFSILAGTPGGMYQCYSFNSNKPYAWSAPSEPLVLRVGVSSTTKNPYIPSDPGDTQTLTSSPPEISPTPKAGHSLLGLSFLQAGILIGISTLFLLLFLFVLFCHLRRQHQSRLRKEDKEAEAKKTPRSSDASGPPLEKTLCAVVNKDRQIEEVRPEDPDVSPGEDPQEVTYAQLNVKSLKVGVEDPPISGSENLSVYAVLW